MSESKTIYIGDIPVPLRNDPSDFCGHVRTPLPEIKWSAVPGVFGTVALVKGGVADGQAVVPIEPTDKMLDAAYGLADNGTGDDRLIREIWQAMILARP